jgi:hypothetical protein
VLEGLGRPMDAVRLGSLASALQVAVEERSAGHTYRGAPPARPDENKLKAIEEPLSREVERWFSIVKK